MIQTDPLSLIFIACFVFASAFIVATSMLGLGHGHGMHMGHMGGHMHLGTHGGGHALSHTGAHLLTHGAGAQHPTRVALPGGRATAATRGGVATPPSGLASVLSTVNLNVILGFLFTFGLLGYLLHNTAHAGAVLTVILAIICGAGGASALNTFMIRLFGNETGRLDADSSAMEGRLALVSVPIRAGGVGEIIFMGDNGTRRSLGARSTDGSAIDRDADVVIIDYHNGIAHVQQWDAFIAGARDDLATLASPGE